MSRRADIKTGYTCNSNCVFCVIGDKLFTGERPTNEVIEELKLSRRTCDDVVFTGAEVTLRQDFFHLVEAAKRLGYRTIQIQTNGRMFAYREFCERAIKAGANEFSPSLHAPVANVHDGLTRSQGSFVQIIQAIKHLRELGQRIVTNTVAAKTNVKLLPDLARLFVELKVDQFQIAFPHPTGHAATYFNAVVPRMSELAPFLHEAMRIGRDAGISCMVEAVPFCFMHGHEQFVSELFIPPTELVYDGFVVPDYKRDRVDRGKTRFPQCATCRFEPICEGPWREYPEMLGHDEFQPVLGPRVIDTELVLDPERFALLGTPAPLDGLPQLDGKWVALAFYPEDGSPACTAEACSLQSGLPQLAAAGVSLYGISPDPLERHAVFSQQHGLTFPLLSDPTRTIARAFKAGTRTTFILDEQRRIAHVIVRPDVKDHARQVFEAVKALTAPPRSLERGPELIIRRTAKPLAEAEAELGLT